MSLPKEGLNSHCHQKWDYWGHFVAKCHQNAQHQGQGIEQVYNNELVISWYFQWEKLNLNTSYVFDMKNWRVRKNKQ